MFIANALKAFVLVEVSVVYFFYRKENRLVIKWVLFYLKPGKILI